MSDLSPFFCSPSADVDDEIDALVESPAPPEFTLDDMRAALALISEVKSDWQGIPTPLGQEHPLVLNDRHPLRDVFREMYPLAEMEVDVVEDRFSCSVDDVCEEEQIRNSWWSRRRQVDVFVVERAGRVRAVTAPRSPDRSMDRLNLWLMTLGASDAWDEGAEDRARETLRAMLTERQWRHYNLTGSFLETSERSRITYLLRRSRPTVAMSPRGPRGANDVMRVVAVLCLHPIGYYQRSWAGCMVPSDDVIAHLSWVRGDEAGFWKAANQHRPSDPEAGL